MGDDEVAAGIASVEEEAPAKKRQKRNRWGQEPDAEAMALAPLGMAGGDLGGALALPAPGGADAGGMFAAQPGMSGMDLGSAAAAARDALEKAKRAAMFQRQIQEQMTKLKNQGLAAGFLPGEGPKARKLILDEFGRELDEEGNVVPMRPQTVSTLKVNINREKEARLKKILGLKKDGDGEQNWNDTSLKTVIRYERPKRKTFRFIDEGTLVKQEQKLVKKIQEKALGIDKEKEKKLSKAEEQKKKQLEQQEEKEEQNKDVGVKKIEPKILRREPIPDVEWWDMPFLREVDGQKRAYTEVNVEKITPYIEHPIPIKITAEKEATEAPMMHLTPKERKKLRRLKRQERTQEIRDKIKMGILQPPPPKVKMSNLMRVLGDEAIADPSTVERKVRTQVEQRRKEHEQRNEARKLPAEERKQKKKEKWMAEQEPTTQVLVFKIKDLTNKRHLFKIDMNAQQFHLTGCCITCPGVANIVIIEGGPRAVKRYRKLMMRRIKWSEDQTKDDDDDEDSDDEQNVTAPKLHDHCVLIWEGVIKQRNFKNWKVTHARSEAEARKTLADRGSEHYWEMLARHRDPRLDI
jgi:U4/U6 small nuclear ribonucleoprotein PRP3